MQQAWNLLELNLHHKLSQKITFKWLHSITDHVLRTYSLWTTYVYATLNLILLFWKLLHIWKSDKAGLAEPFLSDHVIFTTIILNVVNVVQKNLCFILKLLRFLLVTTTVTWISFRCCLYPITVIHNWLDNSQLRG
jgi:hypothetical protein